MEKVQVDEAQYMFKHALNGKHITVETDTSVTVGELRTLIANKLDLDGGKDRVVIIVCGVRLADDTLRYQDTKPQYRATTHVLVNPTKEEQTTPEYTCTAPE